jgi:cytochrome c peroxidase
VQDTLFALLEQAVQALREAIKGKEKLPAPEVFKNIQIMQKTTAERLLSVMLIGFSRSLGVSCEHCHTPGQWENDSKPPKLIAREMSNMTGRINRELLTAVAGLKDRKPVVNCTTCHRGEVKPALDLGPSNPSS